MMRNCLLSATGLEMCRGRQVLFSNFDLQLQEGQIVGVQGESGSGKTSLLLALSALRSLTRGRILLRGKTPEQLGVTAYRSAVLYVPQQPPALASSLLQLATQLAHLKAQKRKQLPSTFLLEVRSWCARFSLEDEVLTRSLAALSGGERQRAYLALALSSHPDVLLLDEPTSALGASLTETVESACSGRSAIWVSHDDAQLSRVAQRVIRVEG